MYISITNQCTRRCSYCFQKDWYLQKKLSDPAEEMSADNVLTILDWIWKFDADRKCSLLGGEPLLHSNIARILQQIRARNKKVNMITNLSVDIDIVQQLFDQDLNKAVDFWYLNTDYTPQQQKTFLQNYQLLLDYDCLIYNGSTVTLQDLNNIIKRFKILRQFYYNHYNTYQGLVFRIDTAAPNSVCRWDIVDYSAAIKRLIEEIQIDDNIVIRFDCGFNWCELTDDVIQWIKRRKNVIHTGYGQCQPSEQYATADISVQGDVYYC